MSIEKIKNPLQKILNRLDSLDENQKISKLDREYIGQLMIKAYDHLNELPSDALPITEKPKTEIFEFEEDVRSPKASQKEAKSDIQPAPKEEDVPEPQEEEGDLKEPKGPEAVKTEPIPKEEPAQEEKPEPQTSTKETSNELDHLFEIRESTELSERLSQMPINDIWNAMGLNERIFTQNELFRGNQEDFKSTVQQLNQFSDFDSAKTFLKENAAEEYNWAEEGRKNIAKNFIRLVKRKYK